MSEYMINPIWFYMLQLVDALRVFCIVICVVCAIVPPLLLCYAVEEAPVEDEPKLKKRVMRMWITAICLLFIGLIIPSKETLIQMEIARHATYENTELLLEQITKTADHIIEELKE